MIPGPTAEPTTRCFDPERIPSIPEELRNADRWVLWRSEARGDRPTKVPHCATGSGRASSTDPATWSSFERAVASLSRKPAMDGLGFVLGGGIGGFDLDNAYEPGSDELRPWAAEIVAAVSGRTYFERSPSGTGVRVFGRFDRVSASWQHKIADALPGELHAQEIDRKVSGKYFTLTGWTLDGSIPSLGNLDDLAEQLQAQYGTGRRRPKPSKPSSSRRSDEKAPSARAEAPERPARAVERFAPSMSWAAVLEPHGWTLAGEASGRQDWTRPGKAEGISAAVYADSPGFLCVFSTGAGLLLSHDESGGYTKLRAYHALNREPFETQDGRVLLEPEAIVGRGRDRKVVLRLIQSGEDRGETVALPLSDAGVKNARAAIMRKLSPLPLEPRKVAAEVGELLASVLSDALCGRFGGADDEPEGSTLDEFVAQVMPSRVDLVARTWDGARVYERGIDAPQEPEAIARRVVDLDFRLGAMEACAGCGIKQPSSWSRNLQACAVDWLRREIRRLPTIDPVEGLAALLRRKLPDRSSAGQHVERLLADFESGHREPSAEWVSLHGLPVWMRLRSPDARPELAFGIDAFEAVSDRWIDPIPPSRFPGLACFVGTERCPIAEDSSATAEAFVLRPDATDRLLARLRGVSAGHSES